jgi:aryl carrier-like protein
MGKSSQSEKDSVVYLPGIGWQLRGLQFDYGNAFELTAAQGGILSVGGGGLTVAASFDEFDAFAQKTLSGVSYGSGVQSAGSPFIQKRVAAGDSWSLAITADQAGWNSPDTASDTADMDRVAKGAANHEPDDAVFLAFYVPGGGLSSASSVLSVHFTGPAGADAAGVGSGQYCLKLRADGLGTLYERDRTTATEWIKRHTLVWDALGGSIYNRMAWITIISDSRDNGAGGFIGSKISFFPSSIPFHPEKTDGAVAAAIGHAASSIIASKPDKYGLIYSVPKSEENTSVLAPIRVDVRRDVRAMIQIGNLTYPDSGTLFDDVVSLPFLPTDDEPFYLYWWGNVPTGTTLEAEMFDAETGVKLTDEADIVIDGLGGIRTYTPNVRQRRYRVKISFTSTGNKTPTLTHWQILRTNVFENTSLTTVEAPAQGTSPALPTLSLVEEINIDGQESVPAESGASFTVDDYTGELATTLAKGGVPVKIETTFDTSGDYVTLFRGYIQTASAQQMGAGAKNWAGKDWKRYRVQSVGEWARLQEAIAPMRYSWFDKAANQPYKVTDAVREMLSMSYPSSLVSIPDIDVRLFSLEQDALITEPGAPIGEAAFRMARDYLGGYLLWDDSAGTLGKWRMLQQKVPPYNNLAKFYLDHPGGLALPHVSAAYGTSTSGAQTILHTFVRKGSMRSWTERAEGNIVIVVGGGAGEDAAVTGIGGAARITQVAVNVNSYNFLGLDPSDDGYPDGTHPDYIGRVVPIVVSDTSLSSQLAVDWVCRRTFDYSAHAREHVVFSAPLILVTDTEDSEQQRPRPLRYYDAVQLQQLDGSFKQYFVLKCSPKYRKDGVQMAEYHLVRQSNIDELAAMPRPGSRSVGDQLAAFAKSAVSGTLDRVSRFWSGNQAASGSRSEWMSLAEPTGDAIQDLDPTSASFGEFYYMMGFDPLP